MLVEQAGDSSAVLSEVRGINETAARPAAKDITAAVLNDRDGIRGAVVTGERELF